LFFEKYLKKTTLTKTSLELVKDKLEKKRAKLINQSCCNKGGQTSSLERIWSLFRQPTWKVINCYMFNVQVTSSKIEPHLQRFFATEISHKEVNFGHISRDVSKVADYSAKNGRQLRIQLIFIAWLKFFLFNSCYKPSSGRPCLYFLCDLFLFFM